MVVQVTGNSMRKWKQGKQIDAAMASERLQYEMCLPFLINRYYVWEHEKYELDAAKEFSHECSCYSLFCNVLSNSYLKENNRSPVLEKAKRYSEYQRCKTWSLKSLKGNMCSNEKSGEAVFMHIKQIIMKNTTSDSLSFWRFIWRKTWRGWNDFHFLMKRRNQYWIRTYEVDYFWLRFYEKKNSSVGKEIFFLEEDIAYFSDS